MIKATLSTIDPRRIDMQHEIERCRVDAIKAHVGESGAWNLPPVIAVADAGNGHIILDGHHRCMAAQELIEAYNAWTSEIEIAHIPAWIIDPADLDSLLDDQFCGELPRRLADLRDLIQCGEITAEEVAN